MGIQILQQVLKFNFYFIFLTNGIFNKIIKKKECNES